MKRLLIIKKLRANSTSSWSYYAEIGLSGYYLDDPYSGIRAEASGSIAQEIVWNHCCIYTTCP
jgi:hypothetical protein